jgi:transposase
MRHGLLEPSFVPNRIIRDIREFSRLRKTIVKEKNRHTNHLEKFLQTHGFKLSSVLSDILCVSGRKLLNTLAQTGTLTTDDVLKAVRGKTKHSKEDIAVAVCGTITLAEQNLLQLLLRRIDDDEAYLAAVEQQMCDLFSPYSKELDIVDSIPGIDKLTAMTVLAEISAAPQNSFATSAHLCSWAGLTPRNDESAGKLKSRKILPGNHYIKSILCQAAWSAVRVRNSSFSKWFWSHQGHIGQKKAIMAVSRKLLKMIYILLEQGQYYDPNYAVRATE